ncbi:hypothetical protein [Fluviispira sanaruensis]|uniref:Outer membrane protein assembly factor BamE n=1 Tax=Fluviispira sanaruensis TaxID=2493639 RepID=A0A4P2VWR3_FLUSA|nr:hypothetical protein [Fluviispira sanaruensis]BBH53402.1 outer membrane protein assembly factor BamE [Fluviispira sanaruensis]
MKIQTALSLVSLFGASLLSVSCLTVGTQFPAKVAWIKSDKTTKVEIEKAFGPPFRMGYDSGYRTYSYGYYKYSAFADSQTKDLTIRFNANGTVSSYTFSSSFPEDKEKE